MAPIDVRSGARRDPFAATRWQLLQSPFPCQWHKRENVVSYLAKQEQVAWRQRLQRAYTRPEYDEALGALTTLHGELEERNQSAAGSLAEGLEETVTLHRLGLFGVLGRSLKTTNGLESINALVEERCAKAKGVWF